MKHFIQVCVVAITTILLTTSCANEVAGYDVKRYLCNFEGAYWNALVDSNPNGDNLTNGTIPTAWHDTVSDISGGVSQPYEEYPFWEGLALSNHCSKDCINDGIPTKQLIAYVDKAYSGKNFLIYNNFSGDPIELKLESKRSFIESMQIALTTYSYNATINGNHLSTPIGEGDSIWIEAEGFIINDKGEEESVAISKLYLYKDGKPAIDGWKKWYLTSMCMVDKIRLSMDWNYDSYPPAYFAIDDIIVVRHVARK